MFTLTCSGRRGHIDPGHRLRARLGGAVIAGLALVALTGRADAAECPAITLTDMQGVAAGAFPQQYELAEFEAAANCTLAFRENPAIGALNARIQGNPELPPVSQRLPAEPLVVVPYDSIGRYGGTLDALSNAPESGTGEFVSIRHVNLVRYSDDLQTIVPNVAKGWQWNADFTELTFFLRKGHRWSDGAPFTAEDVKFWYDNLSLDPKVIAKPKDYVLVAGEPMVVEVIDPQTVVFRLPAPKPGLLAHFATSHAQAFQPKHFLGQFHPSINSDADKLAQSLGFENGYAVIAAYFGSSDWTDTATPMLSYPERVASLPKATTPTLESHILVQETTEGRHLVANPYFHMVDTAGNQLPYIDEQDEVYVNDNEVRILKLLNSEVDYKSQAVLLVDAPLLMENQQKGDYTVDLRPTTRMPTFSFNVTSFDAEKRKVFADIRFRQAMSLAMNREAINEVAFLGLGQPAQYVAFSPTPAFVDGKWTRYYTEHDPARAMALLDEIGLADRDGDGFRELPNGEQLALGLQFSTQTVPVQVVELVAQDWASVGIRSAIREVTPDEYRSAQSANLLDVGIWELGQPLAVILATNELFVPPFDDYFGHRTGMLWAEYIDSNGAAGVEPPGWVYQMISDINDFQSTLPGTPESAALGARLVENLTGNLLFLGTVVGVNPIYRRNALQNFHVLDASSPEYHRTYPSRPQQWWLADTR